MKNKILGVILLIAIGAGAYYFMQKKNDETKPADQTAQTPNPTPEPTPTPTPQPQPPAATDKVPAKALAVFETSEGKFEVALDGKAAPKTVGNFIKLANQGFYNNLTFHRVTKNQGFHLIQGGDPAGNGSGGPGYTIPAEIGLKHTEGAIAMARLSDAVNPKRESSGSQFYITAEPIAQLDGGYTVFGYVTSGMEVVKKIDSVETDANDMPVKPVIIKSISILESK